MLSKVRIAIDQLIKYLTVSNKMFEILFSGVEEGGEGGKFPHFPPLLLVIQINVPYNYLFVCLFVSCLLDSIQIYEISHCWPVPRHGLYHSTWQALLFNHPQGPLTQS